MATVPNTFGTMATGNVPASDIDANFSAVAGVSGSVTAGHAAVWNDTSGNLKDGGVLSVALAAIAGFLPTAISGTSTTAAVTISAGQATDSTGAAYINTSGNTSWAVSNGNAINGYDGGTTLPNSKTIHFFACSGTSGTGTFASESLTPTFPSGYNSYSRRIFSLVTNSSGALLSGTAREVAGGAMLFTYAAQVTDISNGSAGTSSGTLFSMTVPTGLQVKWWGRIANSGTASLLFSSPDETDVAPANQTVNPGYDVALGSGSNVITAAELMTNTSGQIRARASSSSTEAYAYTRGWTDFRRS